MRLPEETIQELVEQLIRVGIERDTFRKERDKLDSEVPELQRRVAYLERKYEPKPVISSRIVYTDVNGNQVWPDGTPIEAPPSGNNEA